MDEREKDPGALRTIREVADSLGLETHVLRFWEMQFRQIKPLKMRGGRRYYRAGDLDILRRIHHLLHIQKYTIKGAKAALAGKPAMQDTLPALFEELPPRADRPMPVARMRDEREALRDLRRKMAQAYEQLKSTLESV